MVQQYFEMDPYHDCECEDEVGILQEFLLRCQVVMKGACVAPFLASGRIGVGFVISHLGKFLQLTRYLLPRLRIFDQRKLTRIRNPESEQLH